MTKSDKKIATFINQLNKLLARVKKGYVAESFIYDKMREIESEGFRVSFEVNRLFDFSDFTAAEDSAEDSLFVSEGVCLSVSLYSIGKFYISQKK